MAVKFVDVDGSNWRDVARVEVDPEQETFVASAAYYMCLAHFGDDWKTLGIESEGEIVGHVMWAVDPEDDSTWLGGLLIAADHQGQGLGRAAVEAFIDRFGSNLALSYSPDNTVARDLYLDIGFVETGEMDDDEVVARYRK